MILNFFAKKTTTFTQATIDGEIREEILIHPEENMLVCGNGVFTYKDANTLNQLIKKQLVEGGGVIQRLVSIQRS
ncbi:MAG: hypothetical protein MR629_06890 [Helicobacter sp.]|nr:hypothetical protein [Helicobacter sp.]